VGVAHLTRTLRPSSITHLVSQLEQQAGEGHTHTLPPAAAKALESLSALAPSGAAPADTGAAGGCDAALLGGHTSYYQNKLFEEGGDVVGDSAKDGCGREGRVEVVETEVWAVANALAGGAAKDAALRAANITGVKVRHVRNYVCVCALCAANITGVNVKVTRNHVRVCGTCGKNHRVEGESQD